MSDPYFDDVVALFGFEGATIVDESPLAQAVTGETDSTHALSTVQAKFGTQSVRIPELSGFSVPAIALGSQFTIEGWSWHETLVDYRRYVIIAQFEYGASGAWMIQYFHDTSGVESRIEFAYNTDGFGDDFILEFPCTPRTTGNWGYVGIDFDGTNYRCYTTADGVLGPIAGSAPATTTKRLTVGTELSFDYPNGLMDGYLDEIRVTANVARYAGSFTEPVAAFPREGTPPPLGQTYTEVLVEGVRVDEGASHSVTGTGVLQLATAGDSFSASDDSEALRRALASFSETMRMIVQDKPVRALPAAASETLSIGAVQALSLGYRLADTLRVSDPVAPSAHYRRALADALLLSDTMRNAVPGALQDIVTFSELVTMAQGVRLLERLRLTDILAPSGVHRRALAETLRFAETLRRFLGADIAESLQLGETIANLRRAVSVASEAIQISDAAEPRLIITAVASESVELSAATVVKAAYGVEVVEGVQFATAYVAPDGTVTTWVMNAGTGAVSEYSNYNFNSFVQMGNKYLAASDDGLFELNGDTDDGADIIGRIKGGFMQFGGPRHSRLKAAYIAMSTAGDVVLKIETGEGVEYVYQVATEAMHTTKINMGKGQRARYFAYELTTAGQDFDLDTLEFVPVVMQRRV